MFLHKIMLPDGTALDSSVIRSVQLTEQVNDNTDLCPGAACAACAEIELWAPRNGLTIAQGTEITLVRIDAESGAQTPVGVFLAEKPQKKSANVIRVTAYDRMTLLDKDLSPWLREQQEAFPMTVKALVQAACAQCGVELAPGTLEAQVNTGYSVPAFYTDDLTGRQIIQWAAQAMCRFARMTPAGQLEFAWYTDHAPSGIGPGAGSAWTALDLSGQLLATVDGEVLTFAQPQAGYFTGTLSYEDYTTAPIDKVQIRQSDDDVGVIYPPDEAGTNALVLQGNLLLATQTADALRPVARAIFEQMQGVTYTPLQVSIPLDAGAPAPGEIITVTDAYGRTMQAYIMQRTISGQKVTLESTGNARRDSTAAVNRSRLENLNGKMLEIQADIGQLSIKASELSGDFSELKQSVDSISLGVTSQKQYEDILGAAAWTEPYGSALVSDGILDVSGQSDKESGASVYVPAGNLSALGGKNVRISLEYKVTQRFSGGFFRVTLWYVYETEAGGGSYVNIVDPGETTEPMDDWKSFSFVYPVKEDVVTKLQLNPRAQAGASGSVQIRNVRIEAETGVQNTVSIQKDGIEISSAALGSQPTLKDFAALKLDQSNLSLTVVKDGEVRSKFAADDSSVTIRSGVITFASNSLVVESDNFRLDSQGNVTITGSFYSHSDNGNRMSLADGLAAFYARDSAGKSYLTTLISRTAEANPCGVVDVYGRSNTGAVNTQVRLQGGLTDGSIHLYSAFGTEQAVITSGEGNVSWLAGGLDVRGTHGVQANYGSIGKLRVDEMSVNGGAMQTVYWKWDGSLGAYVLSTSP